MKILVTGGAGYIGSHTCKALANAGHQPIVIDSLVYGHEWAVKWGPLYKCDLQETSKVIEILKKEKPAAVVHFAAYAYVGESVKDPAKYYSNNVGGTLSLLSAMKSHGISNIVFSSTCATYGIPAEAPIHEGMAQNPINPYGQTKYFVEKILQDFGVAYGIKSANLRYFNASGADAELEIGEDHDPETHLIPLTIQAAFDPTRPLTVMGSDYQTADGTCVRDYIHVTDLAEAHVLALGYLEKTTQGFSAFNLGTGKGSSVKEVIETTEIVTGKKVAHSYGDRRPGDPPSLVADGRKAMKELSWIPKHSELKNIISTAGRWYEKRFVRKERL